MTQHAPLILALLLCLFSCKARKNIVQTIESEAKIETEAATIDKSHVAKTSDSHISEKTSEDTREFTRKIQLDSAGNIRSIQETWRDGQRSHMAIRHDSSRTLSLNDISILQTTIARKDSSATHESRLVSDSRLIQGVEWVWVILSAVLVLSVAVYLAYKKLNPNS